MSNEKAPLHRLALNCVLYPVVFFITFPLEYSTWRAYRKEGYDVPNYFRFVYERNFKYK